MSANLTLHQLRSIFRLVGECTELGADPIIWRKHLAQGIPSLIQDCFVNVVDSPSATRQGEAKPMIPLSYCSGGVLPNDGYPLLHEFMQRAGELSPMVPSMLANPNPQQLRSRHELVPDRDWFYSDYYQHYVRPMGLAEQLTSIDARTPQSVSSICILSIAGEDFSSRQRLILKVLHQEITRQRIAGKLVPLGGFNIATILTGGQQTF